MYAALVPEADTGTEPTYQLAAAVAVLFTSVHPFEANVAPFSKPPSPVAEIMVVCANAELIASSDITEHKTIE
jgi:hypothetical protein